jgi:3-methyladenine DNA glycosylase/8-oxoguanine DNA glycosylase
MAVLETTLRPALPYSLAACARMAGDATRMFSQGVLHTALWAGEAPASAKVWQSADGRLQVRLTAEEPEQALDELRFVLASDVDLQPFLRLVRKDSLLRDVVKRNNGYRPLRVATVSHSLLRAVAGQLIQWRAARLIEDRVIRLVSPRHGDRFLPPTAAALRTLAPARLASVGLAPRRAVALAKVLTDLDPERLRAEASRAVAVRLERVRNLGPWSTGVVSLYGLGRYDHGLVGDLGLLRLCSVVLGRQAEVEDTRELLDRYGAWAGLASLHLVGHPYANRRGQLPQAAGLRTA